MGDPDVTNPVKLSAAVTDLPGVAEQRARLLERLDIHTVSDLLRHLPTRYEREWSEGSIDDLPMNGIGSARGTVVASRWIPGGRKSKGRFEATLEDHSERIYLVWFNARYLRNEIHAGMQIRIQGKVKAYDGKPQMINPKWELLDPDQATPAKQERLKPIYPATEDLSSHVIETLVADVLPRVVDQLIDPLDEAFLNQRNMPSLAEAYRNLHRPQHEDQTKTARRRLAYNELLLLQLGIMIKRHFNDTQLKAPPLKHSQAIDQHIRDRFPFKLTEAQDRAVHDLVADLQRDRPMNRLVQGDVGAGKTVVALYALLMAAADRQQGALMAPTELLAEQHYISISSILEGSNVRIELITGGQSASGSKQRAEILKRIENGEADIVIGTQALLTESVRFKDLAVVVVDEQHRFGVVQRAQFRSKTSKPQKNKENHRMQSPHYLVMTATPIPRTLSLTIFGDLDVSTIDALPPGRTPITTRVVGPQQTNEVYGYVKKRITTGEQAYVVVPTIDAAGHQTARQLRSVREHVKLLSELLGPDAKVVGIHGQLKAPTRESIMSRFREGRIDALVATTVIEVGVDVPNATLMIVEHAERFGLAQLHQLRGRIGRGSDGKKSLCVFVAEPKTEDAAKRIEAIASTTDGFKIAEQDLEIRGIGDFFGTRQHGLPPLRLARIPQDMELLQMARRDAREMIDQDPDLSEPGHKRLKSIMMKQHGKTMGLIDVG